MFSSLSKEVSTSKCYLSRGALPQYVDLKQLPSSKRPFATILNQHFTHTVPTITCAHSWNQLTSDSRLMWFFLKNYTI